MFLDSDYQNLLQIVFGKQGAWLLGLSFDFLWGQKFKTLLSNLENFVSMIFNHLFDFPCTKCVSPLFGREFGNNFRNWALLFVCHLGQFGSFPFFVCPPWGKGVSSRKGGVLTQWLPLILRGSHFNPPHPSPSSLRGQVWVYPRDSWILKQIFFSPSPPSHF